MSFVVCCCQIEVKYRKRNGSYKIVNDRGLHVSEVDTHLNDIMRKANFSELVSVKLTNIHQRPLQGADDTDSDSEVDEREEIPYVVSGDLSSPSVVVDQ